MYCHKCGVQIADDDKFCNKCGAKVAYTVTGDTDIDGTDDEPTELIFSIAKVEEKGYAKFKFPLFIDDIPIDELSNGQKATYKIKPGEHCIQIGFKGDSSVRIWICATRDNSPINLNYIWGVNIKRDIVCLQPQVVTKPSERTKFSLQSIPPISKIGLLCAVLGFVGLFLSWFMTPSYSGSIVSAEAHLAAAAALPLAMGIFIGSIALIFIGALLVGLPDWRRKKEFQKELQNRKSQL